MSNTLIPTLYTRLSGFIVIQVFVYFKLYPKDHRRLKSLVCYLPVRFFLFSQYPSVLMQVLIVWYNSCLGSPLLYP